MNRVRIAYYLRALAAEIERGDDRVPAAAGIFDAASEAIDVIDVLDQAEEMPVKATNEPATAIIRRKWSNRRHAAYTAEETAFIAKCHETGDDARTIAGKLERRFGFRVSDRAVWHRIAKIEGREAR